MHELRWYIIAMSNSHSVTIDRAGRLVVPKALRDALGFVEGQSLQAAVRDGCLELVPEPVDVELVQRDGLLVITPGEALEPLTRDDVRDAIETVRR